MWSPSRSAITFVLSVFVLPGCRDGQTPSEAESGAVGYTWRGKPAVSATVEVAGRIVARSTPYLPDPVKSEYADCLFSCEVEVLEIRSGEKTCRNILVLFPGFLDRKWEKPADFQLGEILDLKLAPYSAVPPPIAKLQMVDQIDDLDLERYFAAAGTLSARAIDDFPDRGPDYFKDAGAVSSGGAPPVKPDYPRSQAAFEERSQMIAAELDRLRKDLSRHGGDFEKWTAALDPFYRDIRSQLRESDSGALKKDVLYFRSLRNRDYAGLAEAYRAGEPGPVTMLTNLSQQLRDRAIDLIVVPLPFKEEVFANQFSSDAPEDGIFVPYRHRFLLDLAEADVEVVDLVPAMQERFHEFPHLFYDAHDFHPADGAIQVIADEVAARLRRYEFPDQPGYVPLKSETRNEKYRIARSANGLKAGAEYPATVVTVKSGGFFEEDGTRRPSPLVLLGDSCNTVPGHFSGDGAVPARLAHTSGVIPDTLLQLGGSNRAMRILAREGGNFLADRWVVVFVFAPSKLFGATAEFGADGGWDLIDLPPLRLD